MTARAALELAIEAVEKATEGSGTLSRQVLEACGWTYDWCAYSFFIPPGGSEDDRRLASDLAVTTSLDAALTLVPEGALWAAGSMENGPWARILPAMPSGSFLGSRESYCEKPTPTLALCLAALRARLAMLRD